MKTSLGDFVRSPQCYVSVPLVFKPQASALIDVGRFTILHKPVKSLKLFSLMNIDCSTAKQSGLAMVLLQ